MATKSKVFAMKPARIDFLSQYKSWEIHSGTLALERICRWMRSVSDSMEGFSVMSRTPGIPYSTSKLSNLPFGKSKELYHVTLPLPKSVVRS